MPVTAKLLFGVFGFSSIPIILLFFVSATPKLFGTRRPFPLLYRRRLPKGTRSRDAGTVMELQRPIDRTRRGLPILSPEAIPGWWERWLNPVILAAVGARGARQLIRQRLESYGLREAQDWWGVA